MIVILARKTFNGHSASLRLHVSRCPVCDRPHSFYATAAEWEAGRLARCPVSGERLDLRPAGDGTTAARGRAWLAARARLRAEVAAIQAEKHGRRQRGGAA